MKCDENGGCPMRLFVNNENMCVAFGLREAKSVVDSSCHLTPADFDIIKAMVAGDIQSFGFPETSTIVDPEGQKWEQLDLWIRR
jgi:hypothetical protein